MLDPALAARIEGLALQARLAVEGALSGHHRSRLHGSSVEFSQHKEYTPGDEIRHIDWKTYAKADRYYVKQYEQESQLTSYMLLDASGSMGFQGDSIGKLEYAAQLISALSYLLVRQRDHVGLNVFGSALPSRFIPPRTRPTHLREIFSMVGTAIQLGASGTDSVRAALQDIVQRGYRRRSLLVLASDLLDATPETIKLLRQLRARNHDIAVFHILDPHELEFPYEGMTMFAALEGDQRLLVNPASVRSQYKRRMAEFLEFVKTGCVDIGIAYFFVPTSQSVEQTVRDFIDQRNRR